MYTSWFWVIVTKRCNYNYIPDFPSDNFDVTESPSTKTCSFPTCWPTYFTWCTCRSFILRKTSFYTTRWVYAFFGQRYSLLGTARLHVTTKMYIEQYKQLFLVFSMYLIYRCTLRARFFLYFRGGRGPCFKNGWGLLLVILLLALVRLKFTW